MTIRPALHNDLPRLREVLADTIKDLRRRYIDQWDDQYPDGSVLVRDVDSRSLFVLTAHSKIWAFVTMDVICAREWADVPWKVTGRCLAVHRLAVSPHMHRSGFATRLMDFVEEHAKTHSYDAIRLDAFSGNPAALKFYENRGYQKAGIVRFRKGDFICFEKAAV